MASPSVGNSKNASRNGNAKIAPATPPPAPEPQPEARPVRRPSKIATVSHTLEPELAERLRHFAFRERISESAIIEFSLRAFFAEGEESELGDRLREAGAALRRKST